MSWDVIVLGVGGVGSAALYHLARRGAKVLGLDRFAPGHDRGSSHGATRMIRLAYFEHPDYVPLLRRAFELWEVLQAEHGTPLYRETGVVEIGPPDGEVVPGVLRAAAEHGLPVERVERLDGLSWPDSMVAVFERRAGLLAVEECVRAHAALSGAEVRLGAVHGWRVECGAGGSGGSGSGGSGSSGSGSGGSGSGDGGNGDGGEDVGGAGGEHGGVIVETDAGPLRAARLVLAPGPWAGRAWGVRVLRKSSFWYASEAHDRVPAFYFELPGGHYYGFPRLDAHGLKAAEHTGGREVDDPLAADRAIDPAARARVEAFLATHVPGASRTLLRHEACFYTMTPDGHFLLGRHPRHPQVVVAAGLSGHGFKFAPVLGEILADLALDGTTRHRIGLLDPGRFGG